MMMGRIEFNKYESRGAYHWDQVSRSVRRHNALASARYDAILSALGDVRGQLLLDIGGGDDVLSYLMTRLGAQTVTVDTTHLALRFGRVEFARRGLEGRAVEASACALPFSTRSFDGAVCSDVIEHVQSPTRLLTEAERVLCPGGRFVLTTPLRVTEKPLDHTHVRESFADELAGLLTSAFSDVTVAMFAPMALMELFRLPFRWLGGRPLFRYLFNAADIYLSRNPFAARDAFRYSSMLIATGQKG